MLTIVAIVQQFIDRHSLADLVVVADAGRLAAANLKALGQWHDVPFTNGQVIDTLTPKSGQVSAGERHETAGRTGLGSGRV